MDNVFIEMCGRGNINKNISCKNVVTSLKPDDKGQVALNKVVQRFFTEFQVSSVIP